MPYYGTDQTSLAHTTVIQREILCSNPNIDHLFRTVQVKACGLTAGKLNTAIVLLVQQTLDPQLENTGSTAPHEVVIYSLPERPEKAHTLCVQVRVQKYPSEELSSWTNDKKLLFQLKGYLQP